MKEIRIKVHGDAAAEESLLDWLRQEPGLRGRVRHDTPPPQAGTMGSLGELVVESLVTGTIGTLMGLMAQSLSLWLGQRRSQGNAHTTVTVTTGDGRSVTVTSAQAGEAEQLLRLALEGRSAPDGPPPTAASDVQGR
ncbi:hypothetical protein AQJ23_17255 [Streptomyces antibioticus]|nr:hypothetical protein [Streptomyces antibioticus]KUN25113.1 hypothetical protein AQJ23_17255 [Streptomyces antibioticus]